MGSFNSAPKILNEDTQDNDIDLGEKMAHQELLTYCQRNIDDGPELISRKFQHFNHLDDNKENAVITRSSSNQIRVLQWNILSQALGENNDNFVCCPDEALNWKRRRYQMMEEIIRYQPDVICLQEVDHFNYLKKMLSTQGYNGAFFPKPDSPCMYINFNNGPDGCAIFYQASKYELLRCETRILEVWHVQSNQVAVLMLLRERSTGEEVCIVTTHLKARNGALLAALRNEQGKDLLEFVATFAGDRPVILCGDFNAEPTEPIYNTVLQNEALCLASAYCSDEGEPPYTTWKVREEGEICHTIDYIFYSKDKFNVNAILQFPTSEEIGEGRIPSFSYPSDHFALVCDLTLNTSSH